MTTNTATRNAHRARQTSKPSKYTHALEQILPVKDRMRLLNDKFGFRTVEEVRTAYLEQSKIRSQGSE